MSTYLEEMRLTSYLIHILNPICRLIEDETIRDIHMSTYIFLMYLVSNDLSTTAELKLVAQELQDLIQEKVGTTKFTAVYTQIRQKTMAVRQKRKADRSMLVNDLKPAVPIHL